MKKLYPLLCVLFLIYWGCEEETPTEVTLWVVVYSVENTTNLNLQSHGLTGEIPPEIGNLINLEILRLGNNELTGSIPPEIENLTNLGWLDFSFNQLTGSILPEIGNLSNLNRLGLYYNQLSEEIPEVICNLVENDCSILLYNNQLCPPYPECLTEEDIGYQDTTNCE